MAPPLPFEAACRATLFDFGPVLKELSPDNDGLAVMFISADAGSDMEITAQNGLAQEFEVSDGACRAISEPYRVRAAQ